MLRRRRPAADPLAGLDLDDFTLRLQLAVGPEGDNVTVGCDHDGRRVERRLPAPYSYEQLRAAWHAIGDEVLERSKGRP